jgi:hypothetical protein
MIQNLSVTLLWNWSMTMIRMLNSTPSSRILSYLSQELVLQCKLDAPILSSSLRRNSKLIDTEGNFNMTNDLSSMINVIKIKPFNIGMAAKESNSTSQCTHRGDFPIPMFYVGWFNVLYTSLLQCYRFGYYSFTGGHLLCC